LENPNELILDIITISNNKQYNSC